MAATIFESGLTEPQLWRNDEEYGIEIVDLTSGTSRFIRAGFATDVTVAPNKTSFAYFKVKNEISTGVLSKFELQYSEETYFGRGTLLYIGSLNRDVIPQYIGEVEYPLPSTLLWSSDSRECAVLAQSPKNGQVHRLYRINGETGKAQEVEHSEFVIHRFIWVDSTLIVNASLCQDILNDQVNQRIDWWRVENDQTWINLTQDWQELFPELYAVLWDRA